MYSKTRALMLGAAGAVLLAATGAGAAHAQAKPFEIPAQPLGEALALFGAQGDQTVVTTTQLTQAKTSRPVSGVVEPGQALAQMLEGTGLTYRREGDVFMIVQAGEGGSGPQAASAVEALIVTAQKKEEQIQDVPIAISAFTQKSLDAQKLEGGFDLLKAIPNVTFSKNNFTGYNFSIRGIGTKAVSATTDPGVAVSFNNTTLIVNRLFEQEYFDVERVEVLRGPQGTLYGRNATSGVINVLSARPRLGEFEGDLKLEGGNYNAQRVRGMVNIPVGDTLALRVAGAVTKRDGYGFNEAAGTSLAGPEVTSDVDNRDLWSLRATLGWEPIEQVRVNALWERFEEDDARVRTSKQLCHRDPGVTELGGFDYSTVDGPLSIFGPAAMSQGCLPGSLYDQEAFGVPNGASMPYIQALFWGPARDQNAPLNPYWWSVNVGPFVGAQPIEPPCDTWLSVDITFPIDICNPDPYAGVTQTQDLRSIHSLLQPVYRAKADIFELSIDVDLSDSVTLTSQTVFNRDEVYATQDYNRFTTRPIFPDSSGDCVPFDVMTGYDFFDPLFAQCQPGAYLDGYYNRTPGGVFNDPQLGPSDRLVAQDLSQATSEQFNQEFRLVSNFDAPLNFSLGTNFTRFETENDYFVFVNTLSLLSYFFPFNTLNPPELGRPNGYYGNIAISCPLPDDLVPVPCLYVDPNPLESINGDGHNYFRSNNPYELTSSALFGELYWQVSDTVKVTLGARMTWDKKVFTPVPSQLMLVDYRNYVPEGAGPESCTDFITCPFAGTGVGGRGSPPNPKIKQEWREPTGRIIVDWKPDLGLTDESMFYASYAHGYKGGGANPPGIAAPSTFWNERNSVAAPPTFEPEFIDAFEFGTKNTLLDGALILNGAAFYYFYEEYQVSKIVDRSAANENFDARVYGLEAEWILSPTRNLRFNGTLGYLQTQIGGGGYSIDLMDRAQGGDTPFGGWSGYTVIKPGLRNTSNCVVPTEALSHFIVSNNGTQEIASLCPGGGLLGFVSVVNMPDGRIYDPNDHPLNKGAGFLVDLGGKELPNAPHWTASFGAQYRIALPGGWDATARVDHYWQAESFARVYNTEYDRLQSWQNTNFSLWFERRDWGVTAEVYVKNAFDEEPITDAFLNSDDSGLTTNVFTLDPRLVGVSVRKSF